MQVAALYDVHGNLPALEAVLADLHAVEPDLVVVGGDALLGPMPAETLALLLGFGDRLHFLRGNTEREILVVGDEAGLWPERARWTRDRLTAGQLDFLAGLPQTVSLELDGLGSVLFCHGSPRRDDEILTAISPEERVLAALGGVSEDIVVCGHTHVRFDRAVAGKRLVNPGSVGMPYEGRAAAFWALLGVDVELRETAYEVESAAAAIRATGFPDAGEFVETVLDATVAAAEATEQFESLA